MTNKVTTHAEDKIKAAGGKHEQYSREVRPNKREILEKQVAEMGYCKSVHPVVVRGVPVSFLHHQHESANNIHKKGSPVSA